MLLSDRTTWHPYMRKLELDSLMAQGDSLARRQVKAEIGFWNGEGRDGWRLVEER